MELINPRVTIQNTTGKHWLVTVEHAFSEHEVVHFTANLPKTNLALADVERAALLRLCACLDEKLGK